MLKIPSLALYSAEYIKEIDQEISRVISSEDINKITKSIAFGGKRIRPIILILLSNLLGGKNKSHFMAASTGIELIHLASLLHDDVIDQSPFRHSATTSHILFGNQKTILGGDYLFAESFKQIVKCENLIVLRVISNATSVLATGEINQLSNKGKININLEEYEEIIYKKTASLFEATGEIAAILQDSSYVLQAKEFGKNVGMAFQVIDDLIDYTSTESNKKQGTDFFEEKITLPIIFALSKGSKLSENEKQELVLLFKERNKTEIIFEGVKEYLKKGGAFEFCATKAFEFCVSAKDNINSIPINAVEKEIINDIIDFFSTRIF
jgi:octaprenyl-diphosphate synthase